MFVPGSCTSGFSLPAETRAKQDPTSREILPAGSRVPFHRPVLHKTSRARFQNKLYVSDTRIIKP